MSRMPGALWIGPSPNITPGGMGQIIGVVIHIEQGSESGSESWFRNPAAQVSAHFMNPKTGALRQMVDTADKAWAEVSGNPQWISVENEGLSGEALTPSQAENVAQLAAWAHTAHGVPLRPTDDPNVGGLAGHSTGQAAWGGHTSCPGAPIMAARSAIVARATSIIGGNTPPPPPPGPAPSPSNTVRTLQTAVHVTADGKWGSHTDTATGQVRVAARDSNLGDVRALQHDVGTPVDGAWGPHSAAALTATVGVVQQAVGAARDGLWGPATDRAFAAARTRYYH